jgi:protein-L-isoaspartate O-methyltransferase
MTAVDTLLCCTQDTALPISCGQTMPSFSVHAKFLALLEPHVQPGSAVLDLGAGACHAAGSIKSAIRRAAVTADQLGVCKQTVSTLHGKRPASTTSKH